MEEIIEKAFEKCTKEKMKCEKCPFFIYATDFTTCVIMSAFIGMKGVKIVK